MGVFFRGATGAMATIRKGGKKKIFDRTMFCKITVVSRHAFDCLCDRPTYMPELEGTLSDLIDVMSEICAGTGDGTAHRRLRLTLGAAD